MEGKDKSRYVDYNVLEGRKPPSKKELEEGELEHLYVVDHNAWEKKMKEKKSSKSGNNVRQMVLKALKDISNGAARFSRSWVHEGPRSFIVAKRNLDSDDQPKKSKPQLPPVRVIREDGKTLNQNDQDELDAFWGKKPPIDTKDKSLSQCSIDLNTLSGLSGGGPGNTRFLKEYKENLEAADEIVKEYQTSQQCLDPDIEIRQLKKKIASLELQVKDIWVHMRKMGADIYKLEKNKNDNEKK